MHLYPPKKRTVIYKLPEYCCDFCGKMYTDALYCCQSRREYLNGYGEYEVDAPPYITVEYPIKTYL